MHCYFWEIDPRFFKQTYTMSKLPFFQFISLSVISKYTHLFKHKNFLSPLWSHNFVIWFVKNCARFQTKFLRTYYFFEKKYQIFKIWGVYLLILKFQFFFLTRKCIQFSKKISKYCLNRKISSDRVFTMFLYSYYTHLPTKNTWTLNLNVKVLKFKKLYVCNILKIFCQKKKKILKTERGVGGRRGEIVEVMNFF